MKKYIDIDKIINEKEIPKKLWKYEELMKEKPNWNKSEGAKRIYKRKEYNIYKVNHGFIVHNTNKPFKSGHTHVKSFYKAKSFIDLCVRKKIPNTPRAWEIESLMRITNNNTYYNKLRDMLEGLRCH